MLGGMANPFDSIETSLNAVAVGALGNATLTWGSASVAVVFDATYLDTAGMANSRPQARCLAADVAAMSPGASVSIESIAYTVQAIEPDGLGMATLILRRA